jgi:hypothetical protein
MKLQEWQAILVAYGVLLIGAQTSLAPLASLMAWGIAITYVLDVTATKGNLLSNLFQQPSQYTGPIAANQMGTQAIQPSVGAGVPGTPPGGSQQPVALPN